MNITYVTYIFMPRYILPACDGFPFPTPASWTCLILLLTKNKHGDKLKEAWAAHESVFELQVTERLLFDSKITVTCARQPSRTAQ